MTVTDHPRPLAPPVAVDLYRDIHKGIRADLFDLTLEAGRLDPADPGARRTLADHVGRTVALLRDHAEHEDVHIEPVLTEVLPDLADAVATDHAAIEARLDDLVALAATAAAADDRPRVVVHQLHLELAAFTGTYLHHEDLEERLVMPALEVAIGVDAVLGIHQAIVASIPPAAMAESLALMLPAMNVDDRTELLTGIRDGAPAEVMEGIWALAASVLTPTELETLAVRLDA